MSPANCCPVRRSCRREEEEEENDPWENETEAVCAYPQEFSF